MTEPILIEPQLFPNLDFFKMANRSGKIILETNENFQKQTYRNRYEIAGPNGSQSLIVPIKKFGKHNCPLSEVGISYETDWQKIHWRTLETAYNSSPYFLYYKDDLEKLIFAKHQLLYEFAIKSIEFLVDNLNLNVSISQSTIYEKSPLGITDLRNTVSPKKPDLFKYSDYYQVYKGKLGFMGNLSALDLLFNEGPAAEAYLT